MDGERFLRRSELINEMEEYCMNNKINSFSVFLKHCKNNNEEWFKELLISKQVFNYMKKFLKR